MITQKQIFDKESIKLVETDEIINDITEIDMHCENKIIT